MIVLHEKIDTSRPLNEAFAYVSDFRTCAEWDATAFSSEKLTPGPAAVGSRYRVRCALPVGSVTLLYTITRLETDQCIVLQGTCRWFTVEDVIQFSETPSGTHIDYRASFDFSSPLSKLESRFESGMQSMGRDAVEGLRKALDQELPAPETSAGNELADKLVLPGLAMFSRLGYVRGRRHWPPLSASMSGKHVVITGASAGLGRAAALRLAELGAELTLVIRDESKARPLMDEIQRETGQQAPHVEIADLSLMRDVEQLTHRLQQRGKAIDVLVNNAGALFNPRSVTSEGLEQSFALLLLSPYRLTEGLQPLLAAAGNARVINVVSGGMYSQQLKVDELIMGEEGYSGSVAYARAKRALMVMTERWAERWQGQGIVVNAMHPGWADTPGVESALPGFHRLTRAILRSPEEGADTIIWLAAAPEAAALSGKLFLDRQPRTTHLLARTRENPEERDRLEALLAGFDIAEYTGSASGEEAGLAC